MYNKNFYKTVAGWRKNIKFADVVCGVKIDRLRQQAYQEGKFISIGICDPGGVVPINHWIWYNFDKREPVMSRTYPYDHTIPEAFQRQLAAKQSPASSSQGAGIRFSSPSLGGNISEEQGFAHGDGIPDDFKHFLEMHPGMSFEEAKRRFKDEQKTKQRRKGPETALIKNPPREARAPSVAVFFILSQGFLLNVH